MYDLIYVHEKHYSLPIRAYSHRTTDELKLALEQHPDRDLPFAELREWN
jgi:hypothetical protein